MQLTRASLFLAAASLCARPTPGQQAPVDEAKRAGKTVDDFREAEVDAFGAMDGLAPGPDGRHVPFHPTPEQIKGRNTWLMWCGGNEAFWNWMSEHSFGLTDLVKTLDTRKRSQGERFSKMGLISDPNFRAASKPGKYGLWLDEEVVPEPAGVDPAVYGSPSGIVGLRLFVNPEFDEAARTRWNPERFYADPDYYQDPTLVRPYRVGMSCAFCHVAFHPLYPPENPEEPRWENLSSSIGNQYWRANSVFGALLAGDSFVAQLLASSQPGTVDTSLIASDGNNNPNTMNAIFQVGARLGRSQVNPLEAMSASNQLMPDVSLADLSLVQNSERRVPHVLVDGADSIGVLGALARVYINIGQFHQLWNECHNPLIGLRPQKPFSVEIAEKNSVYWQSSAKRVVDLAKFFLASSPPFHLADAPGGRARLESHATTLAQGRRVFAENCFSCHSSKQPSDGKERLPADWKSWSRDPAYLAFARAKVDEPDFLDGNYLSTDNRYPVTLIGTNAARALADNAARGHVWADFSSEAYKNSPSVGRISFWNPYTEREEGFDAPAGGPGYYRVPTLVSIWATAPFFHNNELGAFTNDPSVNGRLRAFDDAVAKLLWPESRLVTPEQKRDHGTVHRTSGPSYLRIPRKYLPEFLQSVTGKELPVVLAHVHWTGAILLVLGITSVYFGRGKRGVTLARVGGVAFLLLGLALEVGGVKLRDVYAGMGAELELGPIPAGTPINLIANLDATKDPEKLKSAVVALATSLLEIKARNLDDQAARDLLKERLAPRLLEVSKCPDLVVDRGHTFGAELSDADKHALISFLETF